MSDVILADVADGIAVVTMHRPDARNALNTELRQAVPRVLRDLDADPGVRVIILTGADPATLAASHESIQARGRAQQR